MSIAIDCPGCSMGNHAAHRRDYGLTPGLIGGAYCDCEGDCTPRFSDLFSPTELASIALYSTPAPEGTEQ